MILIITLSIFLIISIIINITKHVDSNILRKRIKIRESVIKSTRGELKNINNKFEECTNLLRGRDTSKTFKDELLLKVEFNYIAEESKLLSLNSKENLQYYIIINFGDEITIENLSIILDSYFKCKKKNKNLEKKLKDCKKVEEILQLLKN